jgi:uncharacterized Zn-finger protein
MSEVRIVTCRTCGGDKGWESHPRHFNPVNGDAWGDWVRCPYCDERGEEEIEVFPVAEEDLWPGDDV